MIPPQQIKVGPYRFSVHFDSAAIVRAKVDSGQPDRVGETHRHRLTITIDPELAPDQLAESLLHETLHAIFTVIRVDEKMTEERFIQLIAPTLLGVLRDNPTLVAFLTTEQPLS